MHFGGATHACLNAYENEINLRNDSQNVIKSVPVFSTYSIGGETLMVNKLDVTPAARIGDFSKSIVDIYNSNNVLAKPGDYANSIVVIGIMRQGACFGADAQDIWCVSDAEPGDRAGKRYGVEIQANVISNLLTNTYIKPVPLSADVILIVFMILLGVGVQMVGPGWLADPIPIPIPWTDAKVPIPLLLFVVTAIYLFVMVIAYQRARLLFPNAAYHLTALIISYFMMRRMLKQLGRR
jgi:CHASE2 domain-containing sensor protein